MAVALHLRWCVSDPAEQSRRLLRRVRSAECILRGNRRLLRVPEPADNQRREQACGGLRELVLGVCRNYDYNDNHNDYNHNDYNHHDYNHNHNDYNHNDYNHGSRHDHHDNNHGGT